MHGSDEGDIFVCSGGNNSSKKKKQESGRKRAVEEKPVFSLLAELKCDSII